MSLLQQDAKLQIRNGFQYRNRSRSDAVVPRVQDEHGAINGVRATCWKPYIQFEV
jgi:hypothetical protein